MAFTRTRTTKKRNSRPLPKSSNKYGSRKVTLDGVTFDSMKEANRYAELKILEKAGEITDLKLQYPFELVPAKYEYYERYGKKGQRLKDGKRTIEQSVVYKADFLYRENGKLVVEDTKGMKTEAYIIKRKLMLHIYGIRIREI